MAVLGCIVVFFTTYTLMLPANTLEHTTYCGLAEHTHTDECYGQITSVVSKVPLPVEENTFIHHHTAGCYDEAGELFCGEAEFVVHTHDGNCYNTDGSLWCNLPEIAAHTHDESCGGAEQPDTAVDKNTDGQVHKESHTHTDECYEIQKKLVCGFDDPENSPEYEEEYETGEMDIPVVTDEEYSIADEASDENSIPIFADGEEAADGAEIGVELEETETERHVHTEDCYSYGKILVCTEAESAEPEPDLYEIGLTEDTESAESEEYTEITEENPDGDEPRVCLLPEVVLHEHDVTCYDLDRLICKIPAVYEHQHTEQCKGICYTIEEVPADTTILTCTVPEGEGGHTHSCEDGCYDEYGILICTLEETAGHVHDAHCYGKWELTCGMEEHTHTEECILEPEYEIELTSEEAEPYADSEGESWGYNEDGSIYWGINYSTKTLTEVAQIAQNTPYVITGNLKNHALSNKYDNQNRPKAENFDPNQPKTYEIWYFELTEVENQYRIYSQDGESNKIYLKLTANTSSGSSTLSFVDTETDATAFTLDYHNNYEGGFLISSNGNYINLSGSDRIANCDGYWAGWNAGDEGSTLKIMHSVVDGSKTANRLDTVKSSNTVINLFDYWTNNNGLAGRYESDKTTANDNNTSGINKGHDYWFVYDAGNKNNINTWTGVNGLPRQGIVANKLEGGYPRLSGNSDINGTGSTESLEYIFNPKVEHDGKVSYRNVNGLLCNNSQGYYVFDSSDNMAEFNEEKNEIYIYDKPGVYRAGGKGQFFPFNKAPEVMESDGYNSTNGMDSKLNHYFGLTLTTRFIQLYEGFTNDSSHADRHETSFHFSGDDDVWIFIDDVLVGDLGGIHDACGIDINFATGEVSIYNKANPDKKINTITIRDAFKAAGKWVDEKDEGRWRDNTFADGTTHTLKFFYLERGNYESNLELKYNMISVPETAIYKVDQYGAQVPGARFAVYAADDKYNMLSKLGGTVVNTANLPAKSEYDKDGNLLDNDGKVAANALYVGTTDSLGEMIFEAEEGVPFTMTELEENFGTYFILREIEIPKGYRVVSKDIHLEIWKGGNTEILRCNNTPVSGTRASATMQVTATDDIWLNREYEGQNNDIVIDTDKSHIQYCTTETNESGNVNVHGTLFAVVMKYTGNIDINGNATNLGSEESWTPVYGTDKDGYTLVPQDGGGIVKAAIEAAKNDVSTYNDNITFMLSPSSEMQVTLENLPGHITTYYRMLKEENKGNTRYTVAFYWTDGRLEDATTANTYGVYSHSQEFKDSTTLPESAKNNPGFKRAFGANIQIPNLVNNIYVQKMDENNNFLAGAKFAIYKVNQKDNGDILYYTTDNTTVELPKNSEIDLGTGEITVSGKTIMPAVPVSTTGNFIDALHNGSAQFTKLEEGQYIVKEIKAPDGYKINTTDVMVLVTEDTIYTNAGTEYDGVYVGRGPGYIVNTLDKFASEGQIDNTLSWIFATMQITDESSNFADALDDSKYIGFLTGNVTNEIGDFEQAVRTYLKYAADDDNLKVFNYVSNDERSKAEGTLNPSPGRRRLFYTSGWSKYELWQDYEWGKDHKKLASTNYENWTGSPITQLFSRSTYIRFTDYQETTLDIVKVDEGNHSLTLSDAEFVLYRIKDETVDGKNVQTMEYYSLVKDSATGKDKIVWTADRVEATVVKTGAGGHLADPFIITCDGTYYIEETKAPAGHVLPGYDFKVVIKMSEKTETNRVKAYKSDAEGKHNAEIDVQTELNDNGLYVITVTIPNATGHMLPETGGSGTTAITVSGLSLMACAAAITVFKKKNDGDDGRD